jgi:hypothetical protein
MSQCNDGWLATVWKGPSDSDYCGRLAMRWRFRFEGDAWLNGDEKNTNHVERCGVTGHWTEIWRPEFPHSSLLIRRCSRGCDRSPERQGG